MNLIFIGLVGSGYKRAAQLTAELTGLRYVDTDEVLTRNLNLTLQDYYSMFTPAALGDLSYRLADQLAAGDGYCIAVGDAMLTEEKAMKKLAASGYTVYLSRSLADIAEHCEEPEHPQLRRGMERLPELMKKRGPLFSAYAQCSPDWEGSLEAFAAEAAACYNRDKDAMGIRVRREKALNEDMEHLMPHLEHRFSLMNAPDQFLENYLSAITAAIEAADNEIKEYMDEWI